MPEGVGGAGQPPKTIADLENRIKALENADVHAAHRFLHENPEIKAIYKNFLGKVGGPKAINICILYIMTSQICLLHLLRKRLRKEFLQWLTRN